MRQTKSKTERERERVSTQVFWVLRNMWQRRRRQSEVDNQWIALSYTFSNQKRARLQPD